MDEALLEWHRVDRTPRRTLAMSVVLVMVGSAGIGAAFVRRLGETASHFITLASAVTMFVGVLLGVTTALAAFAEDVYLGIRKDALVLHWSKAREVTVAWENLAEVAADDDQTISLALKDGAPLVWSVRSGGRELAKRLVDAKQKASLGLLG